MGSLSVIALELKATEVSSLALAGTVPEPEGAVTSFTLTMSESEAKLPAPSRTSRFTAKVPGVLKVYVRTLPASETEVLPSVKVQ